MAGRPPTHAALVRAARRLGRAVVDRGWQMASAESCTGGMLGHVVTEVPRASDHYLGGILSYSDAVKEELLGVPGDLLKRVGAVSAEVAEAMTAGVLARFPAADLAVAITGIAGPDGGSEEKPVGLTYVAAALRSGPAIVERHVWRHDRSGNKAASTLAALDLATRVAWG
ncbi:MAG: CinA family protein [Chloroflexi bacterium]|nr:CinA family protein [Chloroflexota bacterium]